MELTAEELKEMLLSIDPEEGWSPNEECIELLMKMCSSDGGKKLKVEEAINTFTAIEKGDDKEMMKTTFRMCDCDEDGFISKKELARFAKMLSPSEMEDSEMNQMINMIVEMKDEDEDGKLNYAEFCNILESRLLID